MAKDIPSRAHYMINLLDALRALGGEAHREQVFDWMTKHGIARRIDVITIQTHGGSRFRKHVDFSRKELFDAGLIADAGPGVWQLTASGEETFLDHATANQVVRLNQVLRPIRVARRQPTVGRPSKRARAPVPTRGPEPVSWTGRVCRDTLQPALTYLMRWGTTDVWKVGHAINVERRLTEVNKHVPVELLNTTWNVILVQPWENCILAYAMEQEIFKVLVAQRSQGERLRCTEAMLLTAWNQSMTTVAGSLRNPNHRFQGC